MRNPLACLLSKNPDPEVLKEAVAYYSHLAGEEASLKLYDIMIMHLRILYPKWDGKSFIQPEKDR